MTLGRDEIQTLIPHRPPFLFIDQVIEVEPQRIVARTFADPRAPYFQGHYPGNAVMPGVLICECAFQAGAVLIARRLGGSVQGTPVLTRIREAKFKHIVRPGDTLDLDVTLDETLGDAYLLTGRVSVEGRVVLRVEFACMLT